MCSGVKQDKPDRYAKRILNGPDILFDLLPVFRADGFPVKSADAFSFPDGPEQFSHSGFSLQACSRLHSRAFTQASTSAISAVGSKRATTLPCRSTTNLVKFHLMAGLFL